MSRGGELGTAAPASNRRCIHASPHAGSCTKADLSISAPLFRNLTGRDPGSNPSVVVRGPRRVCFPHPPAGFMRAMPHTPRCSQPQTQTNQAAHAPFRQHLCCRSAGTSRPARPTPRAPSSCWSGPRAARSSSHLASPTTPSPSRRCRCGGGRGGGMEEWGRFARSRRSRVTNCQPELVGGWHFDASQRAGRCEPRAFSVSAPQINGQRLQHTTSNSWDWNPVSAPGTR